MRTSNLDSPQLEKFKQTARDLECDESEEAFAEKLKKVAKPTNEVKPEADKDG